MHIILQFVLISKLYIVDFFPYQYIYYDQFTRPYILNWTEMWNFSFSLLSFILNILHRISLSDPSVQFSCLVVSDSMSPWTAAHQASLSITNSWSLLKLMFIESVIPSIHLIFCRPLLLPPSIFPSIRVFSTESVLHIRWPKSFGASASTSVLPMNIQGWFPLGLTGWISLQSKGLSRVFSSTTVWKNQFLSIQPSLWSNSHIHTWLLEKP